MSVGLTKVAKPALVFGEGRKVSLSQAGGVFFSNSVRRVEEFAEADFKRLSMAYMMETRSEFRAKTPERFYNHETDDDFLEAIKGRLS